MRRLVGMLGVIVAVATVVQGQWPTDDEPFALMGCRWFRYRGYWEAMEDSLDEEENTEAVCLTVAVSSIMNYHRWPKASYFDAMFSRCHTQGSPVAVAHRWRYELINGPGGRNANCESDDPASRTVGKTGWSGLDEIRKMMYVVERSFGYDHECFRAKTNECEGLGDYSVHHLMRNRFGYPTASSLSVKNPEARKAVMRNIREGLPVIAIKCEHVFVLDGIRKDPKKGTVTFHACDYVNADETTGWFTWREMVDAGMVRVVAGLAPDIVLRKKPGQRKIAYWWGDDFIPQSSGTSRKGFLRIVSSDGTNLGHIDVSVSVRQFDSLLTEQHETLATHRQAVPSPQLRIPARGTFTFDVYERAAVTVVARNREAVDKKIRIVFHDFDGDHDLEAWREKKVLGVR
ncbi:MAG: hypothetical protein GF331_00085 [Chitinivibrionales bacterium]|nr:hypothetical protein [Chitinivibrionales bacterium]